MRQAHKPSIALPKLVTNRESQHSNTFRSPVRLHRATGSERDRRHLATTADLAAVRKLVADLFAEGIEATVPAMMKESVDAVVTLKNNEVSLGELAAKLALDKSVTSRRVRDATERGYLGNIEARRGRPAGSYSAIRCGKW